MKFTGRDQDDVAALWTVYASFANILDITLLQYHQFVVVMIVKIGGEGAAIVCSIPIRIKQLIIDYMVFPVYDFDTFVCRLLCVIGK
jgi:hypothetical protein